MDVCARILHFICLFYLPAKDVDGWKKLQERLGDNCLLIADQTLKKGLPISEQKPETILTDTPDDTNPVVLPDKPSVNYLSCGALTLEATISQTLAKATHIKGLTACMHVFTFQAWEEALDIVLISTTPMFVHVVLTQAEHTELV